MSSPAVCIAITVWNQVDFTMRCLASVSALDYPEFDVLLVNNGSTDDTVARVRQQFPQVTIIDLPQNYGPTVGFNTGLRHGLEQGYPFVFLLNNDTTLAPDCLRRLIAAFDAGADVGMVMPKIFYAADPQRIWSVGGRRNRLTLEVSRPGQDALDGPRWQEAGDLDDVPGCAVVYRRELLADVGLLDEAYYLYYEDTDFALRVRRAGWRIRLAPDAHLWHAVSASSGGSHAPRERYWMARSSVLFFRRHARGWRLLFVLPWRFASALRWSVRLLRAGQREALRAYWRGLRDGLRVAPAEAP
jgi:hypothetical protein